MYCQLPDKIDQLVTTVLYFHCSETSEHRSTFVCFVQTITSRFGTEPSYD
jgi:hypothetical protein